MRKFTSVGKPLAAALALGCALGVGAPSTSVSWFVTTAAIAAEPTPAGTGVPRPQWAASATGRIEPKDGLFLIATQTPGRVADVAVKINDKVQAGDLLVRLEEDDLITRANAAAVEAQVRERERDEEVAKGLQLERRQAEDSVASAERGLYRARLSFDEVAFKQRAAGTEQVAILDKARFSITAAREQLANSRASLTRVLAKDGMPLATRLESSLASARAELALAEAAVERARVRAPFDATVLAVHAKFGELVAPSPDTPLVVIGDVRSLRAKAEVEERDASKVKQGQKVVVKGDAYPNKTFEGTVTSVSQTLSSPRIAMRGVRRPNDIEVIEVMVALDGLPPLLPGMRVDVFFKADGVMDTASPTTTPTPRTN